MSKHQNIENQTKLCAQDSFCSYTTEELNLSLCGLRNLDVGIAAKEGIRFADVFWPMLTGNYVGKQKYGTNYAIPGNKSINLAAEIGKHDEATHNCLFLPVAHRSSSAERTRRS